MHGIVDISKSGFAHAVHSLASTTATCTCVDAILSPSTGAVSVLRVLVSRISTSAANMADPYAKELNDGMDDILLKTADMVLKIQAKRLEAVRRRAAAKRKANVSKWNVHFFFFCYSRSTCLQNDGEDEEEEERGQKKQQQVCAVSSSPRASVIKFSPPKTDAPPPQELDETTTSATLQSVIQQSPPPNVGARMEHDRGNSVKVCVVLSKTKQKSIC